MAIFIRVNALALAAAAVVFLIPCLPAAGAPLPHPSTSRPRFDESGVFIEAATRFGSLVTTSLSGVVKKVTYFCHLMTVSRHEGTRSELETSARYASGFFTQEMSFDQMDNPGMRTGRFTYADGWANGQPFKSGWDKWYHDFENDALVVDLKKVEFKDPGSGTGNGNSYPFTSAEFGSHKLYGSGCCSVFMQPARDSGVSSLFYTLSGEYDVPAGFHDPKPLQNEIDAGFVGKNTWGFQTNFFSRYHDRNTNSGSGKEGWHDLDFDTAAGIHKYSFKWSSSGITWWVDGVQVRNVVSGSGVPSPHYAPMRVLGNVWPENK